MSSDGSSCLFTSLRENSGHHEVVEWAGLSLDGSWPECSKHNSCFEGALSLYEQSGFVESREPGFSDRCLTVLPNSNK